MGRYCEAFDRLYAVTIGMHFFHCVADLVNVSAYSVNVSAYSCNCV